MLIERVRITNFRSVRDLEIELGKPQIIFEGKNDTGKSNIVHAIDLALRHFAAHLLNRPGPSPYRVSKWSDRWNGRPEAIFRVGASTVKVELTVRFAPAERVTAAKHEWLTISVEWLRNRDGQIGEQISFSLQQGTPGLSPEDKERLGELFAIAYRLVEAHRRPREENFNPSTNEPAEALPVWRGDNLKSLLFAFKNHPRPEVQARFDNFVRRCGDPAFPVGELTVGVSPGGRLFARTRLDGSVFDLEDRSDGIQQLVFLLALAVCHMGSIVAIEEPEAHLNEALQRTFWDKLREMQAPGGIEQVIVTSHSHVFELESDRIVVSRDEQGSTTAIHAPPVVEGPAEYESLRITREGTLQLTPELMNRLGVGKEGGLIYADTCNGSVRLLTSGAFAKETLGGGA